MSRAAFLVLFLTIACTSYAESESSSAIETDEVVPEAAEPALEARAQQALSLIQKRDDLVACSPMECAEIRNKNHEKRRKRAARQEEIRRQRQKNQKVFEHVFSLQDRMRVHERKSKYAQSSSLSNQYLNKLGNWWKQKRQEKEQKQKQKERDAKAEHAELRAKSKEREEKRKEKHEKRVKQLQAESKQERVAKKEERQRESTGEVCLHPENLAGHTYEGTEEHSSVWGNKGYGYKVTFGDKIEQFQDGRHIAYTGYWKGDQSRTAHPNKYLFKGGGQCDGGIRRQTEVTFVCGNKTLLSHLSEPSMCNYKITMQTPDCCV